MAIGLFGPDKINNEQRKQKCGNEGALDIIRRGNVI
jgi:hypothetical protein